jgi:hypothetical protein
VGAARVAILDVGRQKSDESRLGEIGPALANKMARVAWALLAHGGTYRAPRPAAAA